MLIFNVTRHRRAIAWGKKPVTTGTVTLKDWAWAYPTYTFNINKPSSAIELIKIDPKGLMADVDKTNNTK